MLAFICAIGMAFTAVDPEPEKEQANDYILLNETTWVSIPEQPCQEGVFTCQVQDGEEGLTYPVYDEMDDEEPKGSPSPDPIPIDL